MAKVIKPFKGVPDGQTQPRQFEKGDEVTGGLAEVAIAEKWASKPRSPKKPATDPDHDADDDNTDELSNEDDQETGDGEDTDGSGDGEDGEDDGEN